MNIEISINDSTFEVGFVESVELKEDEVTVTYTEPIFAADSKYTGEVHGVRVIKE